MHTWWQLVQENMSEGAEYSLVILLPMHSAGGVRQAGSQLWQHAAVRGRELRILIQIINPSVDTRSLKVVGFFLVTYRGMSKTSEYIQ